MGEQKSPRVRGQELQEAVEAKRFMGFVVTTWRSPALVSAATMLPRPFASARFEGGRSGQDDAPPSDASGGSHVLCVTAQASRRGAIRHERRLVQELRRVRPRQHTTGCRLSVLPPRGRGFFPQPFVTGRPSVEDCKLGFCRGRPFGVRDS
jgi:hypothetical protein